MDRLAGILNELRERIEAQHLSALRALDQLENYLRDEEEGEPADIEAHLFRLQAYLGAKGSNRLRVLDCLSPDWKSIQEIADETGLTSKQVQGVLYAPDVKEKVRRTMKFGDARFSRAGNLNELGRSRHAVDQRDGSARIATVDRHDDVTLARR